MGIVRGDKDMLKALEALRKALIDPVTYLEKAFSANSGGMWFYYEGEVVA